MLNKILQLSKKFISIKSISTNPKELERIFKLALKELNGFSIEVFEKNGIRSALVYNTNKRPKRFKVILNGHLDVIPGKENQYGPSVVGKRLYGVGSMDMKSGAACFIAAFKEVANKVNYPLALQLVTDEQTGSLFGTKYQVDQGVRGDFVIVGETTNFNIVNKAKGVMWLKISTVGKSSHSAYPWQGDNAVLKMNEFLNNLKEKYPIPKCEVWKTTVNISHIKTGNISFNNIPDDCEVWLDVRYIPEDKAAIMNQIKSLMPEGFTSNIVFEEPPLLVNGSNQYLIKLQNTASAILGHKVSLYGAHGTSDATYYMKAGCPGVEFGPIGINGNTAREYVDIPSLGSYYQILRKFLLSLEES